MTRLLVVTPIFHGYGDSIAEAFERIGYETAVHHYDMVSSVVLKAWNKFRYELPAHARHSDLHQSPGRVSETAIQAIRAYRPDVVLTIRGDVLDERFWSEASSDGRRAALWLYDEVRRTPRFDAALVSSHAQLATYSALDAKALSHQGYEALYVPTGFDEMRPIGGFTGVEALISFIGAPLPARHRALAALASSGLPVKAWGRGWSDHPVDRVRTWRYGKLGIPNGRDIPPAEALAVMRSSAATLNVHGDQDGFTMRTFEACAVGGVQLVDRMDVQEFYEPGREVLVFESEEEMVGLAKRVFDHPREFDQLRLRARERTLAEHTFVHRARIIEQLFR